MNKLSNQIKHIRTIKQRSLHDCAKLLDISKEDYHQFEEGNGSLSLPEIELLAIYLEIPPEVLFEDFSLDFDSFSLLKEEKKHIFTELRNKMIGTQLSMERENIGLSLDELSDMTAIPFEALESYENASSDIPLDHLVMICDHLDIPVQSLLFQISPNEFETITTEKNHQERPDFNKQALENNEEQVDLYQQMIRGIKSMPAKDQAEIAKLLLKKLKSL